MPTYAGMTGNRKSLFATKIGRDTRGGCGERVFLVVFEYEESA